MIKFKPYFLLLLFLLFNGELNAFVMCSATSSSNTTGVLFDSGGPSGNYGNNENCSFLINPPCNRAINISFNSFNTEPGLDILRVFDGSSPSGKLLLTASGPTIPSSVTAYSGSVFIQFTSDLSNTRSGFEIIWATTLLTSIPLALFNISDTFPPLSANIHFTDYSSGFVSSRSWDFGDFSGSTAASPVHAYNKSGFYHVKMVVRNCLGKDSMIKTLTVQDTPIIHINPVVVNASINSCNDSARQTIGIKNDGKGTLFYSLQGDNFSVPVEMLALTYGVDYYNEYRHTLNAINSYYNNYHLTELNTTNPLVLDSFLRGKDVLLLAKQETGSSTVFAGFASVLNNFVRGGGTVIICGTSSTMTPCIFSSGLFSGGYAANVALSRIRKTTTIHPYTMGVDTSFNASVNTFALVINNADATKLINFNTFDVVTTRDTGRGHAVYIGFDFDGYDSNAAKTIANVVRYSNYYKLPDWLNISKSADTFPRTDSSVILFKFYAQNHAAGVYHGEVVISSNDPVSKTFNIPVRLTIVGTPMIVIHDSIHSFDSVLKLYPKTDTILVQNPGCDTLRISSIKTTTPYFFSYLNKLKVAPFTTAIVPVTFVPPASGFFRDTLNLQSNAGNSRVFLNGFGVNPPTISFKPDTIRQTVMCNDSVTNSFYIHNNGLSDLHFNIYSGSYSPPVKMLALTYGVDYYQEYLNTLSAINRYFTNYSLQEVNTTNKKVLDSFLKGKEVLLIADQETSNPSVFSTFDSTLNAFVNRGGVIIFCGSDMYHMDCMFNTNIFTGFYAGSLLSNSYLFDVKAPNHPLTKHLPSAIYSANAVYYSFITDVDKVQLLELNNTYDVAAYRKIGKGQAVYIGYDYYSYDTNAARLVSNAVMLASRKALPDWLTLSQYSNRVRPGDSVLIYTRIKTSGMNGGNYKATIVVNSDDPVHPVDTVPLLLTVNCKPKADFYSNDIVINIGDSIYFTDNSVNFPTSWKWYFPYSNKPFSTQQNPVVSYPLNGYYDITLVVENPYGKDSITKKAFIQVVNNVKMCSVSKTTKTTGILLDSGGALHDYSDNEYCAVLIEPTCANTISLFFDSLNIETNYDYIYVYDGSSKAGKLLLTATGTTLPAAVKALSGKMYIVFESDQLLHYQGFRAHWIASMPTGNPPVSGFSVTDSNPPVKTRVYFSDTTSGKPFSWYWDFGDGDTSTAQNPSHLYRIPGTKKVKLVTVNCFGTDSITRNIYVQDWPHLSCSPASFKIDEVCKDSIMVNLDIYNSGTGAMTWEIDSGNSSREIELLGLTYGVNYNGEYKNTLQAIRKNFPNFHLSEVKLPDANIIQKALAGKDVLLVAEQITGLPVYFATFSTVFKDFVTNGGTVIFCGSYDNYANCMFSTGLFHGSYFDYLFQNTDTLKVINNKHPVTAHLKDTLGAAVITYLMAITDTDAVRLIQWHGKDVVTVRQIGKGKVIFTGFNYYQYSDKISKIIANAVSWGCSNKLPAWVTPDKYSGILKDTTTIHLTFHKKGLSNGIYKGNIAIYTNDTNNYKKFIPLEFDLKKHFPVVKLGNDTFLCPGDSFVADAGTVYKTFSWNDTLSASHSVWISIPGKYYVKVSDSNNCVSSDTIQFFNFKLPVLQIKGLKPVLCEKDNPVLLKGIPPAGVFSGNGISSGNFIPAKAGPGLHTIDYTFTDSNKCTGKIYQTVTVIKTPVIHLGNDTVLWLRDSMSLDAGDSFASYNWNNGFSNSRILILKGNHFIPGDYVFIAEVTDTNGCFNSDSIYITFLDTVSGIEENLKNLIVRIYPNPTTGIVFLDFSNPSKLPFSIEIIDPLQQLIFQKTIQPAETLEKIDFRGLSKGIYFINLKRGNQILTKKVLFY